MKVHEFIGYVVLSVGSCFCCGYCLSKKYQQHVDPRTTNQ